MGYIYAADVWCDDCGEDIINILKKEGVKPNLYDSDEWPQDYCEASERADTPQHCGAHEECFNAIELEDGRKIGMLLETQLTEEGIKYVIEHHKEDPSEVTELWIDHFEIDWDGKHK